MIAVIFEVWPKPEHRERYLELAATMREAIESIDGFISVERFQSLVDDEKLLSLSFFDSPEALDNWRRLAEHRAAQKIGRSQYFRDYRLRVASIDRDYGLHDRKQAPGDSNQAHGVHTDVNNRSGN